MRNKNYIIKLFFLFFSFPLVCSAQKSESKKIKFFQSQRAPAWHMDGQIISDTLFTLQIPIDPTSVIDGGGNKVFFHSLSFKKNQKIIVLYDPYGKDTAAIEALGISKEAFVNLCKQKKIYSEIEHKVSLKNCKMFGFYKLKSLNFYVLYVNMQKSKHNQFNDAVRSVGIVH